ncbi:MAG: chromate transporter, partial [Burkholderiales bacterium]
NLGLTAPLTAITAAVVGVIASLAIFFAWHVWWPRATAETIFAGGMDWLAVAMTLAAWIALMRYKLGVISVIALCGAAGAITTITRMT